MNKQITTIPTNIVMPAVSAEEAVKAFEAYQDLAKRIMRPEDVQKIQGKEFKKKSFWRKCQRFFNLSLELREEKRSEDKNGVFTYKFVYRAKAPNKAFVDGTGTCSSNEKGLAKTEHNTRAIAETRAKNRAIADLVAFGEVSAEEVTPMEEMTGDEYKSTPANTSPASKKQIEFVRKLLGERGLSEKMVKIKYGSEIDDLNKTQASTIIENLMKLPNTEAIKGEVVGEELNLDEVDKGIEEMESA